MCYVPDLHVPFWPSFNSIRLILILQFNQCFNSFCQHFVSTIWPLMHKTSTNRFIIYFIHFRISICTASYTTKCVAPPNSLVGRAQDWQPKDRQFEPSCGHWDIWITRPPSSRMGTWYMDKVGIMVCLTSACNDHGACSPPGGEMVQECVSPFRWWSRVRRISMEFL